MKSDSIIGSFSDMSAFIESCLSINTAAAVEKRVLFLKRSSLTAGDFSIRKEMLAAPLLESCDSMLVLLATHGCTNLLQRHLTSCDRYQKVHTHLSQDSIERL